MLGGGGGENRALTTKLAQSGIDFYEVVFRYTDGANVTYYRTSWTKSQNGRISLPIDHDYGSVDKAILFAGTAKNKTLLALGLLTSADGDSGVTTISHNTRNITFTMAALTSNISSDGSTTSFKITTPSSTPAESLPTILEQGAGGTSYRVPLFLVPSGAFIRSSFEWSTSAVTGLKRLI